MFHSNVSQPWTNRFSLMCVNLNQMLHSNVIQPKTNVHSLMCCPPIAKDGTFELIFFDTVVNKITGYLHVLRSLLRPCSNRFQIFQYPNQTSVEWPLPWVWIFSSTKNRVLMMLSLNSWNDIATKVKSTIRALTTIYLLNHTNFIARRWGWQIKHIA